MKTFFELLAICTFISGCYPKINGTSRVINLTEKTPANIEQLQIECQSLEQVGDVHDLIKKIDSDIEAVHNLINNYEIPEVKEEIIDIARRIQMSVDELTAIIDSDYSQNSYLQNVEWEIIPRNVLIATNDRKWKFLAAGVEQAYTWSGEITNAHEMMNFKIEDNVLKVNFARPASLIELCQLQKTLVLVIGVVVE
ncbi:MAG: hypothetical protein KDD38_04485, partial [Bdellovibrionales bacterium]|nr:hypothetical protein [Bdellovibrionales bacterium]